MRRAWAFSLSIIGIGALLNWQPLWSLDIWWELAEGRWIWANGFPVTPHFTYTLTTFPYIAHEWAVDLIFYGLFSAAGALGLVILGATAFGLLGALFYFLLVRQGVRPWAAWVTTLALLLVSRFRFPIRPELFSNLFMVGLLLLHQNTLPQSGKDRARRWDLALHLLLFALWSNFHGEFALGLAYLGIVFATTLEAQAGLRLVAALLGLLCNPYGWKILLVPASYFTHQSYMHAATTEGQVSPFFAALILALLIPALGLLLWNWKRARLDRFPWTNAALLCAFGLQALRVNRIFVVFYLVALPIAWSEIVKRLDLRKKPTRFFNVEPRRAALLAGCLIVAIALWRAPAVAQSLRQPMETRSLPDKASEFLAKIDAEGRIYNSYSFGGYLEWRLAPKLEPFCDGRYPYVSLLYEEDQARESPAAWKTFIHRYDADYAALDWVWEGGLHRLLPPSWGDAWAKQSTGSPYDVLYPRTEWALIYWDDRALVFARRTPKNQGLIRDLEVKLTEPLSWTETLKGVREGRISKAAVLQELQKMRERSGANWVLDWMTRQLLGEA